MNKIKLGLFLVAAMLMLSGCLPMSVERADRAVKSQGYTDVVYGGVPLFGCSEDDMMRRKFTGKGVDGRAVSGVVCGGLFKGATVRID